MRSRAPVEDPVLALPKGPSIAVLPFANLSGDPAQDYFADGITEEIITQLTRFRELFVLPRNTTFQYRGRAVDIKKLGRELGVRYVLEGSIRKAAGSIRVSAQLLDATSGSHLWAETFDRPSTAANLFAVQDEITGYVVAQIADAYGVIVRARFTQSTSQMTDSLDAYDCLCQARQGAAWGDPHVHLRARDCLERATALEPSFADGWAWLSKMYLFEHFFGLNPRPDPLDRALNAAQRAVTIDPANQSGHHALAMAYYHRREREQFVAQAEQALALNPNNAVVLADVGYRFILSGQLGRGVALMRKAMRLILLVLLRALECAFPQGRVRASAGRSPEVESGFLLGASTPCGDLWAPGAPEGSAGRNREPSEALSGLPQEGAARVSDLAPE